MREQPKPPTGTVWRVVFEGDAPDVVRDVSKREWLAALTSTRALTDSMSRFLSAGYGGRYMQPDGATWRPRAQIAKAVAMAPRTVQAKTAEARRAGFLRGVKRGQKHRDSSEYQACLPVTRPVDLDALPVWACPMAVRPRTASQGEAQGEDNNRSQGEGYTLPDALPEPLPSTYVPMEPEPLRLVTHSATAAAVVAEPGSTVEVALFGMS